MGEMGLKEGGSVLKRWMESPVSLAVVSHGCGQTGDETGHRRKATIAYTLSIAKEMPTNFGEEILMMVA